MIRIILLPTGLLFLILFITGVSNIVIAQNDSEAALLLDLRKTRAEYEVALQKYRNDTRLYEEKAISMNDYQRSRNELLSREVDYQKLILQLISQQSYITINRAVKYQDERGERKVKVTLKSAIEGNEEYLKQFQDHFDVFTPEMRSGKIYNIYVSLLDNESKTIIGSPYEYRIPFIELGKTATADFVLLKDAENLTVSLNYNNKKDNKNIYLEKDASANILDINSLQFSQEVEINSSANYQLTLERFSTSDDIYRLEIIGLPRQISYEFKDAGSRVSQIKFAQGVNTKSISLQIYLPDRHDNEVVIDEPIQFEVKAYSASSGKDAGKENLEIIPRGRGRIEVRASNLYYEITSQDSVHTEIIIRNTGTRRLDNIRISTENPLGWTTVVEPELVAALEPEKEERINIYALPPHNVRVGAQEIKVRTEAFADNRKIGAEDKTIRIQINAVTSIWGTGLLIFLLLGIIGGVIWFGMKISKR